MSIATSATVRPSRLLLLALLATSLLLVVVAFKLLLMHVSGARLVIHQLLSVVCVLAVLPLFLYAQRQRKVFVIDVSGTGAISLHHTGRVAADPLFFVSNDQQSSEVFQLLKDSTLWSSMLLLRLRSANGQVFTVPVLPDSVNAASFRSLSIACRWIVSQELSYHA